MKVTMMSAEPSSLTEKVDADSTDGRILAAIEDGLPIVSRPYSIIAALAGVTETEVIERLSQLHHRGVIRRLGVVVRHRELGYRANAMVVWDVPDGQVAAVAQQMRQFPFVTLCYRRPRRPPMWPYNLFCMIHGRDRETVLHQLNSMIERGGWECMRHEVLFSKRRFKQRGPRYYTKSGVESRKCLSIADPGSAAKACPERSLSRAWSRDRRAAPTTAD